MEPPVITLVDTHLWKMFNSAGTEMIITKNGRKLFPTIKIRLYNLDPDAEYDVALHMKMSRNCRLKFQAKSGWKEAGTCDPKASKDVYVHFESGKTGHELMMKPLSFDKIRVTNSLPAALSSSGSIEKYNDFVCLNSMHEYLPTVILSIRSPYGKRSFCYPLELTKFIAVTAYQNQQVTEIKINKNPFAKGFRADGQAKKRKNRQEVNVEEPQQKRLSTDSQTSDRSEDSTDRLSPHQPLADTFISPWSMRPPNAVVPYSFVMVPQPVFPYTHISSAKAFEPYRTQSSTYTSTSSPDIASDIDLDNIHVSVPSVLSPIEATLCYPKTIAPKIMPSHLKTNDTSKLGFSVHRILYEL